MAHADTFDATLVTRRDALLTMGALGLLACDGGLPRERSAAPSTAFRPRDRLGKFLVDHMAAYAIPGMTVWVARGGDGRTYPIGRNDVDFDAPVNEDTPYQIASVSKIFAGIAIMLLADEGALDVDAPLSDVLPDVPSAWREIRIHHLLEHTSGLPRSDAGAPGFDAEAQRRRRREILVDEARLDHFTVEERLAFLAAQPLAAAPDLGKCIASLADGRLLSGAARDRMWTRARLNDGTTVDYGLGWTIGELDGETVVGHEGGGCSWLLHATRSGVSVVALSNLAGSGADDTAEQIASLVLDE
jgi:CubicO group peptidase (beta-lactamase class C family)